MASRTTPSDGDAVAGLLRQALIAALGPESGATATAAALAWSARHPEKLAGSDDPLGRLYRVGLSEWRRRRPPPMQLPEVPAAAAPWIDAALPDVLSDLPRRQRVALLLHHGFHRPPGAVAAVLGVAHGTAQRAIERGLARVAAGLGDSAASERTAAEQLAAYAEQLQRAAVAAADPAADRPAFPLRIPLRAVALLGAVVLAIAAGVGLALLGDADPEVETTVAGAATATTVAAIPPVDVELLNPSAVTPTTFAGWEHTLAGPGAVTRRDGVYHMLSAAYGGDVATVAYATSADGVVWTQAVDRPILDLSTAPWAPRELDHALPRSVVVDGDGTWQLFFEVAWFDRDADQLRASIGRAVARDPAGAWVFDARPVVMPDEAFPWMASRVTSPSVVAFQRGFVMVFVAEGDGGRVVGMAQSSDGSNWDVRPGPVFAATAEWAGDGIEWVDLVASPEGMALFYAGEIAGRRGVALSTNGLEWAPHPSNPVLRNTAVSGSALVDSEFVRDESSVLAYIETGTIRTETEVAVLRISLDLESLFQPLVGG